MTLARASRSRQSRRNGPRFRGQAARSASWELEELAHFLSGSSRSGNVDNPAAKVGVVYACIRAKADALGMMPLMVSTANEEVVETGPLVELLERPHPDLSGRQFRRAVSAYLDTFGVVYLVKTLSGNRVVAIEPLSPLELREQAGVWRRTDLATGLTTTVEEDQVYTIRDPDFGAGRLDRELSPRQAVANAISQQYHADVANDHALRYGVGGGIGFRSDQNLTEQQREEFFRQLEQRHSGPRGRHLGMLLEGLHAEQISPTFRDQEFTDLKQFSREDICVAFGLNPLVLGYGGRESLGSGQHTDAAHEVVWNDTHLPRSEWIAEELCDCLAPHIRADRSLRMRDARRRSMRRRERCQRACRRSVARATATSSDYGFWFDSSGVSALAKSKLQQAEQLQTFAELGVPLNDLLESNDLPYEDRPWGNTWYKPMSLVDVQEESDGIDDPPGMPPSDASSGDEPEPNPDNPQGEDDLGGQAAGGPAPDQARQLTEQAKARLWSMWRLSWEPISKSFASRVKAHWFELRSGTLRRLEDAMNGRDPGERAITADAARSLIGEVLFDLVEANRGLIARARPLIREAFRLGGEQSIDEHAAATDQDPAEIDPFRLADPDVAAGIRRRELQLAGINRRVRRAVADTLAEGLTQQESTKELADRVRRQFGLEAKRSGTVARTEVGRSVEEARHQGRLQAGTPLKSWLWSRKETGRPWHFETETATFEAPIPAAADFRVAQTGNACPHPRATNDPEDDINCGCTTIARFPGDSVKGVLARYLDCGFLDTTRLRGLDIRRAAAKKEAA